MGGSVAPCHGDLARVLTHDLRRGDVYWVDFNPARGSEQAGVRPGCIISLDSFNRVMPVVIVAAVTTKLKFSKLAVHLPVGKPLPEASEILPFQLLTVDKTRLRDYMGSLTVAQIADLEHKMKVCWGLS